jgi:hypothetical protein
MSFFRSSQDTNGSHPSLGRDPSVHDWAPARPPKTSESIEVVDKVINDMKSFESAAKIGSVRKRLSMLKLGGGMGATKKLVKEAKSPGLVGDYREE